MKAAKIIFQFFFKVLYLMVKYMNLLYLCVCGEKEEEEEEEKEEEEENCWPAWPIDCSCNETHISVSLKEKLKCVNTAKEMVSSSSAFISSAESDIPDELFPSFLEARKERILKGRLERSGYEKYCLKMGYAMKQVGIIVNFLDTLVSHIYYLFQNSPEYIGYDRGYRRRMYRKKIEQ